MRLRQKKNNNLSEDALYSQFQNQHFQTLPKKSDFIRKSNYDISKNPSLIDTNTSSYAQILTKFINNSNLAKHNRQNKAQIKPKIKNTDVQQYSRLKRFRKTSDNMSFDEQKKIECPNSAFTNTNSIRKKIKIQEKRQRPTNYLSTHRTPQVHPETFNFRKQTSEQNIINNYFIGNTLNIVDYSHFMNPPFYAFNPAIWNSWLHIHPFIKPNLQNISLSAQQMQNGLYRQLQIYERFKQQPHLQDIQRKSLPLTSVNKLSVQKQEMKPAAINSSNKVSPDKIFKRSSYHVAIAYSIYMDNIQKEGRNIKNFNDIDPTRFAKKYKMNPNKY